MRVFVFVAVACVLGPGTAVAQSATADTVVFVVNGADPFQLAGTGRLADQIRASGYPYTVHRGLSQAWYLEDEVRELKRRKPDARVVLIGYSAGVYAVREVAARLTRGGVSVAMVGYVGGDYLTDSVESRLPGVGRVINITGDGHYVTGQNLFFNGADITGAANMRLAGVRHFDLPRHPDTLGLLLAGLEAVSARDR